MDKHKQTDSIHIYQSHSQIPTLWSINKQSISFIVSYIQFLHEKLLSPLILFSCRPCLVLVRTLPSAGLIRSVINKGRNAGVNQVSNNIVNTLLLPHFHTPGYHVWHSNCIPHLTFGAPCQEEISCRLANKKFRCSTTPANPSPTCNCKEHTKYVEGQCIDAPGFGVFVEPAKHADYAKKRDEEEDEDLSSIHNTGVVLRKFVGPISMSFLILIIAGVCIVFHNAK